MVDNHSSHLIAINDGTYDQDRQPVTRSHGYQVGLWTVTTAAQDLESTIDDILRRWAFEWGVWTHPKTGESFVEPCVWFADLEDALKFGRLHNQISVWCWATMSCIEC